MLRCQTHLMSGSMIQRMAIYRWWFMAYSISASELSLLVRAFNLERRFQMVSAKEASSSVGRNLVVAINASTLISSVGV